MTSGLSEVEFAEHLRAITHSAFRLELQPAYLEPVEYKTVSKFLAGDPEPPTRVASLDAWFKQVARLTGQGKTVQRVRVQEDPPTRYQEWERWIGPWNVAAGEDVRYMTRETAHLIGLLPDAQGHDWWLLDSSRLIMMTFDEAGHRIHNELMTARSTVARACAWRDLAVQHSAPLTTIQAAQQGKITHRGPDRGLADPTRGAR